MEVISGDVAEYRKYTFPSLRAIRAIIGDSLERRGSTMSKETSAVVAAHGGALMHMSDHDICEAIMQGRDLHGVPICEAIRACAASAVSQREADEVEALRASFINAIEYASKIGAGMGSTFLDLWVRGDFVAIDLEFPDFKFGSERPSPPAEEGEA